MQSEEKAGLSSVGGRLLPDLVLSRQPRLYKLTFGLGDAFFPCNLMPRFLLSSKITGVMRNNLCLFIPADISDQRDLLGTGTHEQRVRQGGRHHHQCILYGRLATHAKRSHVILTRDIFALQVTFVQVRLWVVSYLQHFHDL